jgi:2-phosphosulfolactate phosphatase
MHVDVALSPAEIDHLPERDLRGATCVVLDVLRATSSIVTGLAHGAAGFWPAQTIEEALALRRGLPGALLGGERGGERIDGFDLGNSPLEYRELAGREVITTTTNGTLALRACRGAAEVIAGALLDLDAVAARLRRANAAEVLIVCAGTHREGALEDVYAAGALIEALAPQSLADAAQVALAVSSSAGGDALGVLRGSRNGRTLIEKGRADEVAWCAQRSLWPVIGVVRDGWIRPERVELA